MAEKGQTQQQQPAAPQAQQPPYLQQPAYPQQQYANPQQQTSYPQQQPAYPQPQYTNPAPATAENVVYEQRAAHNKTWPNYKSKASVVLGWVQIIVGILSVVFNAVGIGVQSSRYHNHVNGAFYAGSGFWASIFFFLSGGFAIGAAKHKTSCMIIANMVLSILSSLFGWGLLGVGAAAVGVENSQICGWGDYTGFDCTSRNRDAQSGVSVAMGALMIVLAFIGMIAAIWSSALCCAVVCCGRTSRAGTASGQTATVTTTYITTTPGQPYVVPTQQYPQPAQQYPQPTQQYPPAAQQYPQPAQPYQQPSQQQQQPPYNAAQPPAYMGAESGPPAYEDSVPTKL